MSINIRHKVNTQQGSLHVPAPSLHLLNVTSVSYCAKQCYWYIFLYLYRYANTIQSLM